MLQRKIIGLIILSICLSVLNLSWTWFLHQELQPRSFSYLVQTNSGDYYRLYVCVNRRTVIADEDVGLNLYPFSAKEGDEIEIRAYCEQPFTVSFEDAQNPIEARTGQTISILYTVPKS